MCCTSGCADVDFIQSIPEESVKQLCAGQVVISLTACVKELVENSLDSGAQSIEIWFKNQGFDSIQVSDNGKGIQPADFESVAKKHCTSKIKLFSDLDFVASYGFRGEALFSIAELSEKLCLTSKVKDFSEDFATKVEICTIPPPQTRKITKIAAKEGTIVQVEGLFKSYPVRRQEFERNLKTQFASCVELLYAYAIVNSSVRFACYNTAKSSSMRTLLFQTQGTGKLMDCCAEIYSSSRLKSFVEFSFDPKDRENCSFSHINGVISKEMPASKESLVFINNRPCDFVKIPRAIQQLYRRFFDPKGSIFCIVFIHLKAETFDVNVTPDKRKIFIQKEGELLEFLVKEMKVLFEKVFSVSSLPIEVQRIPPAQIPRQIKSGERDEERSSFQADKRTVQSVHSPRELNLNATSPILLAPTSKEFPALNLVPIPNASSNASLNASQNAIPNASSINNPLELLTPQSPKTNSSKQESFTFSEEPSYLSKAQIAQMKVIGQFNHGFILASLPKGPQLELYIIDQHAADEKYNFERLFSTFNPKIQRLIAPINLSLSLSEEHYCQIHQKALLACGFHLNFQEQAVPGKRFSLTASAIFEGSIFDSNGKH